ncbi:hypothetical protein K438DRAFT_1735036, partial [Mycena galopus ATCC 62051]
QGCLVVSLLPRAYLVSCLFKTASSLAQERKFICILSFDVTKDSLPQIPYAGCVHKDASQVFKRTEPNSAAATKLKAALRLETLCILPSFRPFSK